MVNKNYKRGYITEQRAKKELEKDGFTVFRTAGSHSLFDLIAINKNIIRLIQLKRVKKGSYYLTATFKGIEAFDNHPEKTIKEIWVWEDRKGFTKRYNEGGALWSLTAPHLLKNAYI